MESIFKLFTCAYSQISQELSNDGKYCHFPICGNSLENCQQVVDSSVKSGRVILCRGLQLVCRISSMYYSQKRKHEQLTERKKNLVSSCFQNFLFMESGWWCSLKRAIFTQCPVSLMRYTWLTHCYGEAQFSLFNVLPQTAQRHLIFASQMVPEVGRG